MFSISEINSIQDIQTIEQDFRNLGFFGQGILHFRGEANKNWELKPAIGRNNINATNLKQIESKIYSEFENEMYKAQFNSFLQTSYLKKKYHSEWLLIQQAQHFGLPTRLMDWTGKGNIAVAFAVLNPLHDNVDGRLYIHSTSYNEILTEESEINYLEINPELIVDGDIFQFINPSTFLSEDYENKIGQRRQSRLGGKFLIQSFENSTKPLINNNEFSKNLASFIIPAASKKSIREELNNIGVNNETIKYKEVPLIDAIVDSLKIKYNLK